MVGDPRVADVRARLEAALAASATPPEKAAAKLASQNKLYVRDQSAQLLEKTREFADLYKAGKDDEARALYPDARTHWERIETVAESFGDLDPKMDLREAEGGDGTFAVLALLLARRLKQVAADLEFLHELRSAYDKWTTAPLNRAALPVRPARRRELGAKSTPR